MENFYMSFIHYGEIIKFNRVYGHCEQLRPRDISRRVMGRFGQIWYQIKANILFFHILRNKLNLTLGVSYMEKHSI